MEGSKAYARWDYDASMSIIRSRKKLMLLVLLALPLFLLSFADAADVLHISQHVSPLGSKSTFAPSFYSSTVFLASIAIGLAAGLITGCIGAGGGFIVTPALMAAGVKGILAVGTDLFHIFAKAIMGTTVHKKLGNVSVPLAIAFLCGSGIGTVAGGAINKGLYNYDPLLSELFISTIYAIILGFLGFYGLYDFLALTRKSGGSGGSGGGDAHGGSSGMTPLASRIQTVTLPPLVTFDEDVVPGGRRLSGWIVAAGGFVVGMLASIMGVGGGFVTFPIFVYVFGVSSMTTVGTDILQIIFTAGLGSIGQYAIYGFVFYSLAMGMLLGSLIGIQIGALTTKVVRGVHIRGFYAVSILAGFVNRAATLPKRLVELKFISLSDGLVNGIETFGNIAFWVVVAFFAFWVISKFVVNIGKLRAEV